MPIHLPPLSRRQFLAGLAAGALSARWALGSESEPGGTAQSEQYLFMSDMHIGSGHNEERHGVKPAHHFSRAVKDLLSWKHPPRTVIVTGDCALMHGGRHEYGLFGELIHPLRKAGATFHFCLGNHDQRENFLAAFPEAKKRADAHAKELHKYVALMKTRLANWFFLDSLEKTAESPGSLGEAQLKWLAAALDAHANTPALVLAHHDATPGSRHALRDAQALLNVILPRKQVKAYIFGHTHCWSVGQQAGMHLVNIPTISAWMSGGQPRGYVNATLHRGGLKLVLHDLEGKHPKYKNVELAWR